MVRKTNILRRDTLQNIVMLRNKVMTPKQEEMRVMSDSLRVQFENILDRAGASWQRKETHELATYLDFIRLTCADSKYEGC